MSLEAWYSNLPETEEGTPSPKGAFTQTGEWYSNLPLHMEEEKAEEPPLPSRKRPIPSSFIGQAVYPIQRAWDIYSKGAADWWKALKGAYKEPSIGSIAAAALETAFAPFLPLEAAAKGIVAEPVGGLLRQVGPVEALEQVYKKYAGQEKSLTEDVLENLTYFAMPGVRTLGKMAGLVKEPLTKFPKGTFASLPKPAGQTLGELDPLRQSIVKSLKWLGDRPLPIPDHWKDVLNASNLRELIIPASERMSWTDKMAFWSTKVATSTARKDLAKMAKKALDELGPTERLGVAAYIKTGELPKAMTLEAKEKVLEAVKPWEDMITKRTAKLKPAYEEVYKEKLAQEASRLFPALQDKDVAFRQILRMQGREMLTDPKQTKEFLTKALENPLVSEETKSVLRDLYNLPDMMVDEVWNATRRANEAVLIAKIRARKGAVSTTPKEGYLPSKHPSLKGLYVEHDIERGLRELQDVSRLSRSWYQKFFLTPWKITKVVARAPTLFRNIFGNIILNDVGGPYPLPFYRVDVYTRALKDLTQRGPAARALEELAGVDTTFTQAELLPYLKMLRYGHNMFDVLLHGFYKISEPFMRMYQASEVWAKAAKYLWNKEHGMSDIDAVLDAIKTTFDYGDVTVFTKRVRETALPFFTWQSKSLPFWIESTIKHPVRTTKWALIPALITHEAIKRLGLTEEEWQDINKALPDYMQKGWFMLMPWRDEKGQIYFMNLTFILPGVGDFAEVGSKFSLDPGELTKNFWQNPAYQMAAAILSKRKASGARLYFDWEAPDVKLSKTLAYIWEQMAFPWLPGGVDAKALWRTYRDEPNAPSIGAAIASQFGFKMIPANVEELLANKALKEQRMRREAMEEMRMELRRAVSEEERESIINRYQKILSSMEEEE